MHDVAQELFREVTEGAREIEIYSVEDRYANAVEGPEGFNIGVAEAKAFRDMKQFTMDGAAYPTSGEPDSAAAGKINGAQTKQSLPRQPWHGALHLKIDNLFNMIGFWRPPVAGRHHQI